ncbi:hypothetical protein Y1Q_0005271 [Alligator mississippiensis]|uniref:Uncharacterized protein n=1 Tax=Alligator mississippiensis TaxID=8496 RepID=A0A151MT74_ALLMI|nr:hypothetical protein Y1Q_0005271 [Alligator mississippiensis]
MLQSSLRDRRCWLQRKGSRNWRWLPKTRNPDKRAEGSRKIPTPVATAEELEMPAHFKTTDQVGPLRAPGEPKRRTSGEPEFHLSHLVVKGLFWEDVSVPLELDEMTEVCFANC